MIDRLNTTVVRLTAASVIGTLIIVLGLLLIATATRPGSPEEQVPPPAEQPVNAVIDDAGYAAAFGALPDHRTSESLRIRTHLAYVEALLRSRPVSHLTRDQARRRAAALDHLRAYRTAGVFPRNTTHPGRRTPVFIDAAGRICAVGYMLRETAGSALATRVNDRYQFALISEMDMPDLRRWADAYGFTLRELAMIQPKYCWNGTGEGCPDEESGTPAVEFTAMGLNLSSAIVNGWMAGRRQRNTYVAAGGLVTGGVGVALGLSAGSEHRAATLAAAGASLALSGWHILRNRNVVSDESDDLAYLPAVSPSWSVDADGEPRAAVRMTWHF